jgi:hypothetical protein
MDADEFLALTKIKTESELLTTCLHDDSIPFIFEPRPTSWDAFRQELVTRLGVSPGDIRIVGSGRLGISIKPGNNLMPFNDKSDIDVAIVNPVMFDHFWLALLQAAYPRSPTNEKLGGWLKKRRNEVYTGWISPLKIHLDVNVYGSRAKQILELRTRWFDALKHASRHSPRRHEDITGRLYRTWQHAELYHLHSMAELKKSLTT